MNVFKNFFKKSNTKRLATYAIGGTILAGAYSLARDIQ